MKKRRLVVCSKITRDCEVCGKHIFLEFILLVPKGQYFDRVVNFPKDIDLGEYSKITDIAMSKNPLPYKRPTINPHGEYEVVEFGDRINTICDNGSLRRGFDKIPMLEDPCIMPNQPLNYKCKTNYEELKLGNAGGFHSEKISMCSECLNSYDYYTVFECEYETKFHPRYSYVANMLAPEFKRLLQQDYTEDVYIKDLERHAADGDVPAMSYLALAYFYGEGVEQNHEEAAKWWRLAAEKANNKND